MGDVCVFGEVLFDHFPDGSRVLGGAPFNVAWHLQAFGLDPHFISAVGSDPEGESVLGAMRAWGMDTSGVSVDARRPTGRVSVSFVDGEPCYEVVENVAFDAIKPVPERCGCHLLYHGTLALREEASRAALESMRAAGPENVFVDVNLRSPYWSRDGVSELMAQADWVKLNEQELQMLMGFEAPGDELAGDFIKDMGLKGIILTYGAKGAEVITDTAERFRVNPSWDTPVVDTVGAGDAFASVIIMGLAKNWPLELSLSRAQAFATRMIGQRGATVKNPSFYRPLMEAWEMFS